MDIHARMRENLTRTRQLPPGVLPLAASLLVLIAVPIARADGEAPVSATGGAHPIAIDARQNPKVAAKVTRARAISGEAVRVVGRSSGIGRTTARVRLSIRAAGTRSWRTVASARVRGNQRFRLHWRGGRPGRYMTRVSLVSRGKIVRDSLGRVFVFRRSFASYYGPGLYGGGLACGGRLTPSTVGVAHKTLPCGTRVAFTLGDGRVVTAPVIDRGPFVAGREWDLTNGLKNKLGFGSTGPVYATH